MTKSEIFYFFLILDIINKLSKDVIKIFSF